MRNPDGALCSWLSTGSALVITGIWGVIPQMKKILNSSSSLSNKRRREEEYTAMTARGLRNGKFLDFA